MIAWYIFFPVLVIVGVLAFFLGAFVASAGIAGAKQDEINAAELRRANEARAKLN